MSRTKPKRNRGRLLADRRVLRARAAVFDVLAQAGGRHSRRAPATFRDPASVAGSSLEDWRLRRIIAAVLLRLAAASRMTRSAGP